MIYPTPENGRLFISSVAAANGLTEERLLAKDRNASMNDIRWQTMAQLRAEGFSLLIIGKLMNRHHTTILHGLKQRARRPMFEGAGL